MTSGDPVLDLEAARAHVEDSLPRLAGVNFAEAKSIISRLTALIKKLGGK